MNVMNREACFGCPLHVIAESNRDPSSRYYVWFEYFNRNRSENVCRNDIFYFAAYCFEKRAFDFAQVGRAVVVTQTASVAALCGFAPRRRL